MSLLHRGRKALREGMQSPVDERRLPLRAIGLHHPDPPAQMSTPRCPLPGSEMALRRDDIPPLRSSFPYGAATMDDAAPVSDEKSVSVAEGDCSVQAIPLGRQESLRRAV